MKRRKPFPKRTYSSLVELASDVSAILSNRRQIRKAVRSGLVSAAFRERLMLVVTQVNDCRYCKRFHGAEALRVGVSVKDIQMFQSGGIPEETPSSEVVALHFARHWAERDAMPDPTEEQRLLEVYGQETVQAIRILLRMIRIGNLTGNTVDFWLYRLSFGRLGLPSAN